LLTVKGIDTSSCMGKIGNVLVLGGPHRTQRRPRVICITIVETGDPIKVTMQKRLTLSMPIEKKKQHSTYLESKRRVKASSDRSISSNLCSDSSKRWSTTSSRCSSTCSNRWWMPLKRSSKALRRLSMALKRLSATLERSSIAFSIVSKRVATLSNRSSIRWDSAPIAWSICPLISRAGRFGILPTSREMFSILCAIMAKLGNSCSAIDLEAMGSCAARALLREFAWEIYETVSQPASSKLIYQSITHRSAGEENNLPKTPMFCSLRRGRGGGEWWKGTNSSYTRVQPLPSHRARL